LGRVSSIGGIVLRLKLFPRDFTPTCVRVCVGVKGPVLGEEGAGEWDPIENDSETRGLSGPAALNLYRVRSCTVTDCQ
jgi:hypothetical protein